MADPKIFIRRSATPSKVPTTNQLALGELAINTYDGKLYLEQDQGAVGVGTTIITVNPWSVGIGSTAYNIYFTAGSVGIGTTNPTSKLTVTGNGTFTGVVTATTFVGALTGNATGLSGTPNITVGTIGATSLNASGVVTATTFSGALTGNVTGNVTGNATGLSGTPNITVGTITATSVTVGSAVTINSSGVRVTGVVTATTFVGALTGTATTATGLSGTPNITVGTIGATSLNASGVVTATTFSGALTGNVTGNATGLSGTPNITVGTIGATSLNASGVVTATTFSGALTGNATGLSGTPNITVGTIGATSLNISGVTTVAAGSTAAPSISPTGDSNTGIFFPAADTIAFGEGGVEVLRINSSSNVGIGITNPTTKLHVLGQNNTTPVIISAGGLANFSFSGDSNSNYTANFNIDNTGLTIGHNSAVRDFRLQTNSLPRITIAAGGNVGIGSTNPTSRLTVVGSGTSTSQLFVTGVSTFAGIATHTASLFGTQASFTSINVTGVVTATSFVGSGANLTNLNIPASFVELDATLFG